MLNVCYHCGAYHADKTIAANGRLAICPACGHEHPFQSLPLLFVCGPSGAGKSTILQALNGRLQDCVLLDGDILWQPEFHSPADNNRRFFETWLRLAKNIGQAGRSVVIFLAGAIPPNIEPCVERRYFAQTHYLSLVCDNETMVQRLRQRPQWRQSDDQTIIDNNIAFNEWLKKNGAQQHPPISLFDTTKHNLPDSAAHVAAWIREKIKNYDHTIQSD
ncbi:MAG: AAA family ATPase [Anaerolineales bacterium]|nr:AAA family ATPase [Anaerolineales bacterium]